MLDNLVKVVFPREITSLWLCFNCVCCVSVVCLKCFFSLIIPSFLFWKKKAFQ